MRALVTGVAGFVGSTLARRLLADGHDVWVAARDPQTGEKAAADLGARFVQLDVTNDASVAAANHVSDDLVPTLVADLFK